jgi:hypothetical protein
MCKIIFVLFLIVIGCKNNNAQGNIKQKNNKQDTMQVLLKSSIYVTSKSKGYVPSHLYEFKNDTLLQTLLVEYTTKQEIIFEITSVNMVKNKTSTLTGLAKGKLSQDPETDEDGEGNAYTAIEYHYNKNGCSLSIRIAMDAGNKARIFEYNCNKFHDSNCPFESVGVLRVC